MNFNKYLKTLLRIYLNATNILINSIINLTEKLIKSLNKEENYLSILIYKAEKNIRIKEDELEILKNQLKNRIRYLYKYGKSGILSEIANNHNWDNLIYRTKYLQILNQSEDKIKTKLIKILRI